MRKTGESSIVTKCAIVIDIISQARKPLVFSEIVERSGFVKSSAHRILAVLQSENLIEYEKQSRTYITGSRLQDWARSSWRRVDIQQAANEAMSALSDEVGMNTGLSVLDREAILYLKTIDVVPFRYASQAGDHAPLHSTAAGKVFLAFMSERRREETLNKIVFEKLTEHTNRDAETLKIQIPLIRKQGYASAMGEELLQVTGIAAPIRNSENKVVACLSLWSLTDVVSREQVVAQAPSLIKTTEKISKKLGWSGEIEKFD